MVVTFPSVCVLEKLLALVTHVPAPLLWVAPGTGGPSRDAALQCAHFGLSLGFPAHLFNVCAFCQAQPVVRLLLHTRLFSPALCLLLLVFLLLLFLFCNWSILGTAFYPLLLKVVLKKPCPSFFFLYCLKEIKVCATFEDKNMKCLYLKIMLNTMSLICMCGKKRSEQITCVTLNL